MADAALTILSMTGPLLFATLGALVSEHAGVLAVFLDGAITLSGFICIAVTALTGSAVAGALAAAAGTVLLLALVAIFNEKTGANPFITGLAVNLLAAGLTSWLSVLLFGTRGVVALPFRVALPGALSPGAAQNIPATAFATALPFLAALTVALVLRHTTFGLNLRASGPSPDVLSARGVNPARYRIGSWCIAAFFASCAGTELALGIGAWVPNLSAGRGWTALAACYLGYRNPLACIGACLLFSGAEWWATSIQGSSGIPSTVILGFPYLLALLAFVLIPRKKN
jgi:simple sugar transport system permease protein